MYAAPWGFIRTSLCFAANKKASAPKKEQRTDVWSAARKSAPAAVNVLELPKGFDGTAAATMGAIAPAAEIASFPDFYGYSITNHCETHATGI